MRYIIRKGGALMGGYPPSTDKAACDACKSEDDALDAFARDSGHKDFAAYKATTGASISDFATEKIEE